MFILIIINFINHFIKFYYFINYLLKLLFYIYILFFIRDYRPDPNLDRYEADAVDDGEVNFDYFLFFCVNSLSIYVYILFLYIIHKQYNKIIIFIY
jgi:hypothetical protein